MPTSFQAVTNLGELRGIPLSQPPVNPTAPGYNSLYLEGRIAAGDGGGGIFRWDALSRDTDNSITIIKPAAVAATDAGRWRRVTENGGNFDFRWFGAKGDGRIVTSRVTTSAGSVLLSTFDPVFSSADAGKTIWVPGAGGLGGLLVAVVEVYSSPTQIALSVPAQTSIGLIPTTLTLGTDDTQACQDTIDAAMAAGVGVEFSCGDYVTGPLVGNGSGFNPNPPDPITQIKGGKASVLSFRGQGRAPFLCRLIAKPGAYAAGQAVITFRNVAGKEVRNFSVESNNVADCSVDVRWVGTATGEVGGAAPSCSNTFTDIWSYRANRTHFDMRQAADTLVSNLHAEGGTAPIGFDFRLGGGGIWMDNCFSTIDAKLLLASQNAGIQNCGFFGGIEITDGSLNYVHFDSSHLYPHTPKRTLAASPLATEEDSADLVITLGPHGLKVGNYIEIFGAVGVGGVSADSYINTDPEYRPGIGAAPHEITAVTDTTVTVVMKETNGNPHQATSTATGGGAAGAVSIIGRGYTVESNITGSASGSRMLKFTACWFNDLGPIGQKYFAGRWVGGARFEACRFGKPAEDKGPAPLVDDVYFDLANWAVAGSNGQPPLFFFTGCSFAAAAPPKTAENLVLTGFEHRMNYQASSVPEWEWPGDIRLPRSAYDESRIRFGNTGWMWKDVSGNLRYINNAGTPPTADTDGRLLYCRQSGAASPIGSVTPAFPGSFYYDTTQNTFYVAFGPTNTDWVPFFDKGANMVSATLVDLSQATGDYIEITGTTTITAFGIAKAGVRKLLRFQSSLTIAHNSASLIIPGGQNITAAAGSIVQVLSLGSGNWAVTTVSEFGVNASFLAAGTVADARLPTTMASKTLTAATISSGSISGVDLQLRTFTVATLPSAATVGRIIYVSDGTGNNRVATSNGTNWVWVNTNTVVS